MVVTDLNSTNGTFLNDQRLGPGVGQPWLPGVSLRIGSYRLKFVPDEFKLDAHHWLILHGRYTCIARKPRCGSCVIEDLCEFKKKNIE